MSSNYNSDEYDENGLVNKFYEEWDSAPELECPACRGTGLDKWEEYDCETCFGEGALPDLSALSDLTGLRR